MKVHPYQGATPVETEMSLARYVGSAGEMSLFAYDPKSKVRIELELDANEALRLMEFLNKPKSSHLIVRR